ncbi:MAG: type III pantothenate kinase [Planctomycetota bacterium]|nr:type III pantothenate kinase [Planctomycetota bacterium]
MSKIKSILACDVGNSRISLGCVIDEKVSHVHRLSPDNFVSLGDVLEDVWRRCPAPALIAASSVQPEYLASLESAARRIKQKVLVVGRDLPLPMETDLPEPERIGTDRLCSAAMAYHRLGGPCVVADFGTAVTIDCVNSEGVFLGGAILPGLRLSAESLARGTSALPEVKLVKPDWVFGADTRQAIIGGIVFGARGALREFVELYATELGVWPEVILTGGDAELIGSDYDIVSAVVPDLCLLGVGLSARDVRK